MQRFFTTMCAIFLFALFYPSFGYEPMRIVHCPSAGIPLNGEVVLDVLSYPEGGLRAGLALGLWDRLDIEVSYGATNLIGRGKINPEPMPQWTVKLRAIDETQKLPAVAIGVDTRGFGEYDSTEKRYEHKSRGLFVVTSRNWIFWEVEVSGHLGMNYSFEERLKKGFSIYCGTTLTLYGRGGISIEYDLAPGDNKAPFGRGRGYLSTGFFLNFAKNSWLYFNLFDLLSNKPQDNPIGREIRVVFLTHI